MRDQNDLNAVTCRTLLNVMPGVEPVAVFKDQVSTGWLSTSNVETETAEF